MKQSEAIVDLGTYRANLATISDAVGGVDLMAVVKADAYGHGMVPIARAAREAGAAWLGVATNDEALALRALGDRGPILSWLGGDEVAQAIDSHIDLGVSTLDHLNAIVATGRHARIHLKVDTGLSRNGAAMSQWPALLEAAKNAPVEIIGLWSHFASADDPDDKQNELQEQIFDQALDIASELGVNAPIRHLANSAAALLREQSRFDLVRIGIASYGLSPAPKVDTNFALTPVLTLRSTLVNVKTIAKGSGVSYGHHFIADRDMRVGLVPLGYGDGIARSLTGAEVFVGGQRARIIGVVCMDQFVIDLDGINARIGDEVVLFGPGTNGEPTAQEWAEASGTINYEIVTRLSGRIHRTYRDNS